MGFRSKPKDKTGVFLLPEGVIKQSRSVPVIVICTLMALLLIVGLTNLYSASIGNSFFFSQLKNTVVGLSIFAIVGWVIPMRHINTYSYVVYAIFTILLIIVFFVGQVAGGSQRWINLGSFGFQPSEFAKVVTAMTVARFFFANRLASAYNLRDLWPILALVGVYFVLIFEQPDLGTAGICVLIAAVQFAFVRIDTRSIAIVGFTGLVGAVVGWFVFLHDYQKLRVLNLFNPDMDPQHTGYNSLQSLVAVGSGNLFGKGFMKGTQTQLQFLPARHTDFIFSVFAEEHGFWGGTIVFVCFGILTYIALEIAREAKDTFCALLAVGIAALIFIEFMINVGMVLGMFPVVGVPLPFFSYGGSAMLTICTALGLLVSISRDSLAKDRARGR